MKEKPNGVGCMLMMLGINTLIIGLLAFSFSHGPYSIQDQERWYRYGSIVFLIAGSVLPAIVLRLGALRRQWAIIALSVWMIAVFIACFIYVLFSGGGV